mmetsp:Transcript_18863/g.58912  ORF Transcript_18863/g.58912 Transcript_18863/m.58912 type:complete len:259 (+) Transcript_18863:194-970(+)
MRDPATKTSPTGGLGGPSMTSGWAASWSSSAAATTPSRTYCTKQVSSTASRSRATSTSTSTPPRSAPRRRTGRGARRRSPSRSLARGATSPAATRGSSWTRRVAQRSWAAAASRSCSTRPGAARTIRPTADVRRVGRFVPAAASAPRPARSRPPQAVVQVPRARRQKTGDRVDGRGRRVPRRRARARRIRRAARRARGRRRAGPRRGADPPRARPPDVPPRRRAAVGAPARADVLDDVPRAAGRRRRLAARRDAARRP